MTHVLTTLNRLNRAICGVPVSLFFMLTATALVATLTTTAAHAQTADNQYGEVMELFVGQTEILTYPSVRRVAIGNGQLADVKVLSDVGQVLLIAKNTGVTDLRVWLNDGSQHKHLLRILSQPTNHVLTQVRAHLAGVEGVQARAAGGRIVIEGQGLREGDVQRVETIAQQFPNVSSYVTPGGVTLRGMVYLDVKVVEVRRSGLKEIGVRWDQALNGPVFNYLGDFATNGLFRGTGLPPGGSGTLRNNAGSANAFFGLSTSIGSVINLLVESGDAKLLAEPKLTCRSGGTAEFLVGGEVPIPIIGNEGQTDVEFKEFGVILRMSPIADASGYINTQVEIEVSTIDEAISVQGIPGFLTRRTDTEMNVRAGQTMVLSGLLSAQHSKNVSKVPGLGHIPVLGELFKSRGFQNDETELVVFVTPHVVDPEHRINRDLLQRAQDIQTNVDKRLRFRLMD